MEYITGGSLETNVNPVLTDSGPGYRIIILGSQHQDLHRLCKHNISVVSSMLFVLTNKIDCIGLSLDFWYFHIPYIIVHNL